MRWKSPNGNSSRLEKDGPFPSSSQGLGSNRVDWIHSRSSRIGFTDRQSRVTERIESGSAAAAEAAGREELACRKPKGARAKNGGGVCGGRHQERDERGEPRQSDAESDDERGSSFDQEGRPRAQRGTGAQEQEAGGEDEDPLRGQHRNGGSAGAGGLPEDDR